jgi:hypothetical protein
MVFSMGSIMVLSPNCRIQILCGHAPEVLSVAVESGAVAARAACPNSVENNET